MNLSFFDSESDILIGLYITWKGFADVFKFYGVYRSDLLFLK
jgi:hypothetical protein